MTRQNSLRAAMRDLRHSLRRTLKDVQRGAARRPHKRHVAIDSRVNLRVSDNVAHPGAVTVSSAEQTTALRQHGVPSADESASDNAG